MEFLVVCPLSFLAGLVDAIAGGGGLISLPAYFFAGLPAHMAIATNKLSNLMGTALVTLRYAMFGYMVRRFVAVGVPCGLLGSFIGSNLALIADSAFLMVFMLVTLPAVCVMIIKTKNLDCFSGRALSKPAGMAVTGMVSLVVGAYDGFYGPGTGAILMLLLTSMAHQSTREAQGTSKAVNLATNLSAFAVFLASGNVMVALGLAAGACNIAGGFIGAGLFHDRGSSIVRPVMLAVVALFAIRLVFDLASRF